MTNEEQQKHETWTDAELGTPTMVPAEFQRWLAGTWVGDKGCWRSMSASQTDELITLVRRLFRDAKAAELCRRALGGK
jgi:hypothetical protein